MSVEGFWDNPESAQAVVTQLSALKSIVGPVEEVQRARVHAAFCADVDHRERQRHEAELPCG